MWPFNSKPNPKLEAFKAEYEEFSKKMFKPKLIHEHAEYCVYQMSFEVCHNDKNRLACILARNWKNSCHAVIEINQDLSLSKKGIYWTYRDWKVFDPRRYCHGFAAIPKKLPNSMKPVSQQVTGIPLKILEIQSDLVPYMTFKEWKLYYKFLEP